MGFLRLAGLVVCALALVGCAFGEADRSDEITPEQLAIMVLPRDELGAAYSAFAVDDDSGPGHAKDVAEDTLDPDDNAAAVKRAGWLAGYELTYENRESLAAERQEGMLAASTSVDLFDTATDARSFILAELGDLRRYDGTTVDGLTVRGVEEFDINVGDEAWGVEVDFRARDLRLHATNVVFRHGRLVAAAWFMRGDDQPARADAFNAALALEARIGRVLAGELDAEPVALPEQKQAPVGRAHLAKMTLALEDLPAGARLVQQGRGNNGRNFVSYYRTFDVENTFVGSSHLMFVRAQTNVFESVASAESMLREIATPKGRAEFARGVLLGFERQTGARPSNVDVDPLPRAGKDTTGVVVTFDLPGGRYRTATVVVRSGRSVAIVSGFCHASGVNPDDMRPLATTARARLSV